MSNEIDWKTNPTRVRPLGPRVLLRRIDADSVSAGGIIIPDKAKDKPGRGVVVAVGAGAARPDGSRAEPIVAVGDEVYFRDYAGTEVRAIGPAFIVLGEDDLLAVVVR